jgi:hypothetical protein
MAKGKIKLLNPVGRITGKEKKIAKRISKLEGQVLGILDNGKEFSGVIVKRIGEILQNKFKLKKVVIFEKGFPAKAAPFIKQIVKECDIVVNGVGH